ncbi:MAG: ComEC/Rec2 family competence protein, partial [Candidatus Angelobacter sp.]
MPLNSGAVLRSPAMPETSQSPLAWAAGAFSCGIWLAGQLHRPLACWVLAALLLVVCTVLAALKARVRLAQLAALLTLVSAGSLARMGAVLPEIAIPPAELLNDSPVEITGHVTNDGSFLAGNGRERFDLQTEVVQLGKRTYTVPVGIRATLFSRDFDGGADGQPGSAQVPLLTYGQRVRFTARLRLPRNFGNPGAFDYEGYLHGIGIAALASAKAEDLQILTGNSGSLLGFWRSRIRQSILKHIGSSQAGLWPRQDAPLFAAMILGENGLLLRNVREEFQQTGIYHLLVVSGMTVALLAFAGFWL